MFTFSAKLFLLQGVSTKTFEPNNYYFPANFCEI
jgi:hypothetical protein